jgi:hypothetical protein
MSSVTSPTKWARVERQRVRGLEAALGSNDTTDEMLRRITAVEQAYAEFAELRIRTRLVAKEVGIDQDRWQELYRHLPL